MTNAALLRRGLFLEYTTLAWNVVGCTIVFAAAWQARSVALAGFGLDSVIEIFASVIVVWQLKAINKDREQFALKLIAVAFFLLALYVAVQSVIVLVTRFHPETSVLGMIWLLLTFTAMLLLAWGKSVTGRALDHEVLQTEAKVTVVDAYLAGAVLVGLVLNALFGFWWADPLAGFVIVYYGLKEGLHAWKE